MTWKPLNKTLFVIPEGKEYSVDSEKVAKVLNDPDRKIILQDHNTIEKVSSTARVIRAGDDCKYNFLKNQKVIVGGLDRVSVLWLKDLVLHPEELTEEEKKIRVIKEWEIDLYEC